MSYLNDSKLWPLTTPADATEIAFQTGRWYTDAGQRIAARLIAQDDPEFPMLGLALMNDVDRGIRCAYVILLPLTQRTLMDSYDHDSRGAIPSAIDEYPLFNELRERALKVPAAKP